MWLPDRFRPPPAGQVPTLEGMCSSDRWVFFYGAALIRGWDHSDGHGLFQNIDSPVIQRKIGACQGLHLVSSSSAASASSASSASASSRLKHTLFAVTQGGIVRSIDVGTCRSTLLSVSGASRSFVRDTSILTGWNTGMVCGTVDPTAPDTDGGNHGMNLWDLELGKVAKSICAPGNYLPTPVVAATKLDEHLLASGNAQGVVQLWDLRVSTQSGHVMSLDSAGLGSIDHLAFDDSSSGVVVYGASSSTPHADSADLDASYASAASLPGLGVGERGSEQDQDQNQRQHHHHLGDMSKFGRRNMMKLRGMMNRSSSEAAMATRRRQGGRGQGAQMRTQTHTHTGRTTGGGGGSAQGMRRRGGVRGDLNAQKHVLLAAWEIRTGLCLRTLDKASITDTMYSYGEGVGEGKSAWPIKEIKEASAPRRSGTGRRRRDDGVDGEDDDEDDGEAEGAASGWSGQSSSSASSSASSSTSRWSWEQIEERVAKVGTRVTKLSPMKQITHCRIMINARDGLRTLIVGGEDSHGTAAVRSLHLVSGETLSSFEAPRGGTTEGHRVASMEVRNRPEGGDSAKVFVGYSSARVAMYPFALQGASSSSAVASIGRGGGERGGGDGGDEGGGGRGGGGGKEGEIVRRSGQNG